MLRTAIVLMYGMMAAPVFADILAARFTDPTTRYGHAVLGDAVEFGGLSIKTQNQTLTFKLPLDHVFEDIKPRLADVDLDGDAEVIVIETDVYRGAALAVYDETGKIAETDHIGTSNRWLAPVGAADFNGDGLIDIAYVDRPHLAKTLRVVSYKDGVLKEIASKQGLTNHKIGWDYITSGIRTCNGFTEIITADARWKNVMATRMIGTKLVSEKRTSYTDPQSILDAVICKN